MDTKNEINRLSNDVSHRICTAQVIVSLSSAIRQLIDNSLDAEATVIDVRCHNHGYDSFEVIDDGTGIHPDNLEALCKPHSTSKLTALSDFSHLNTLGFRGEALNALCSLSNLSITTRCETSLLGTRLNYNSKGEITEQTNTAKSVGTTVTCSKLFDTLPVRRKEFERNSKKEFGKVLSLIQCFALSRSDVKFICSNNVNGKRQQLVCTPGKVGIKEVVQNLFGGRTDRNKMMDVVRCLPDEDVRQMYRLPIEDQDFETMRLSGFVSSCEHGYGRSAADRQFIFVNQRPIDGNKINRVVNEVYQQYNKNQYPTLVLFLEIPPELIDVNVTPDKRTLFFTREKHLLALVRSSILATFNPILGSFTSVQDNATTLDDTGISGCSLNKGTNVTRKQTTDVFTILRDFSNNGDQSTKKRGFETGEDSSYTYKRTKENDKSSWDQPSTSVAPPGVKTLHEYNFKLTPHVPQTKLVDQFREAEPSQIVLRGLFSDDKQCPARKPTDDGEKSRIGPAEQLFKRHKFTPALLPSLSVGFELNTSWRDDDQMDKLEATINSDMDQVMHAITKFDESTVVAEENELCLEATNLSRSDELVHTTENIASSDASAPPSTTSSDKQTLRAQKTIPFSMANLKRRLKDVSKSGGPLKQEVLSQQLVEPSPNDDNDEFMARIGPEDNEIAEKELDRVLKKSDFLDMSIVGQFNNGFIITRLKKHLFIIDQHASDEKYNFEKFQQKAKVESQKLLSPQALDFGAVQEGVLRDNLHIFQANGFDFEFQVDEDSGCTKAYLVSIPVLSSWQFDKNDIDEILTVVTDFPGEMYRPTKLRRIFASRACRRSVMVGTSLDDNKMKSIVENLSQLDQPWNCPHGRPTLRHLYSLKEEEDSNL